MENDYCLSYCIIGVHKAITLSVLQCDQFYYGDILLVTKLSNFFKKKINDLKRNLFWRKKQSTTLRV